jgi:glycosyltransferase involved in cell wall biosynthesis
LNVVPLCLHAFATFAPGGPQVRTARLLGALGAELRHAILPLDGESGARSLLPAGVEASVLEGLGRAGALRSTLRLRALLRAARPDLVLTYNWGAIEVVLAARTLGLAVLHHEDGFRPDEAAGFKRRRVLARRLLLRGVRGVVVPSLVLARIARELWRVPEQLLHHVPNGVRVEDFEPRDGHAEWRARHGLAPGVPLIGWVGHLRAEKNPLRFVEVLARARPDVGAVILGDGPERPGVEAALRAHGLTSRVRLVGHVADPRPWYRAMDVLVLSSDTEQLPMALLEAMACGVAVLSTDVGDVRSVLGPAGEPFVVPLRGAGTVAAMACALDRLAADPALRAGLGAQHRRTVGERYGFDAMAARYRALYRAALEDRALSSARP